MKRILLPAMAIALAALTAAPAVAMSPDSFTKEFVTKLRAAFPESRIDVVTDLELELTDEKGGATRLFLSNVYKDAERSPDDRDALIGRYIAATLEGEQDMAPLDPRNIVGVIKHRRWVEDTLASVQNVADTSLPKPYDALNEELMIVYAEETPRNTRYLSADELTKAGVERADLRQLAVGNLRRILPRIELYPGEMYTVVTAGQVYVPSLLLFDELWEKGHFKVDGDVVVAVPSRDVLLVTGSNNQAGIARLREVAQEIVETGTYTLTSDLFVYRDGKFRRLPD